MIIIEILGYLILAIELIIIVACAFIGLIWGLITGITVGVGSFALISIAIFERLQRAWWWCEKKLKGEVVCSKNTS